MALNGEIAFIVYLEPREVQPENYPYLVKWFDATKENDAVKESSMSFLAGNTEYDMEISKLIE
ncbi:hypothetical protein DAPPUDRAFT_325982 [Daphnia pulex]|uniref:Glutathione S-transferase omega2 isoform b n=1 Tax=Daphnia pulex TaxID=6669 RepID=E9H6D1_DAPPU|nr:hypothetical protein DAPPUDRAFT_325982 [Daphnia pulex]QNM80613.1 glutathione S-transferase omega2 isoform b [Daphnia pulex]|eukprot:EFX72720.1 hypothetical protein DAPPUDRAFT_325982 [Daphnia pulex]